jgi:low affinity Fe/Cu permease
MSAENQTTRSRFNQFARTAAQVTGHPIAFLIAVLVIAVWAVTGPMFGFNDTWQLVINTGTTIVTFLMVFLIQNAQNRDSLALQIKMDEVIRAVEGAHNSMVNLESLEDDELLRLRKKYESLAEHARKKLERGAGDIDCPELDEIEDVVEETKEQVKLEVEEAAADVKKKVDQVKSRRRQNRAKKSA